MASNPPKLSTLETFLSSSVGSSKTQTTENSPEGSPMSAAARAVVLTILNQVDEPVPDDELKRSSELSSWWYDQIVAQLQREGLIQQGRSGYLITDHGRDVAAKERLRLLSPW
jgi:predicted methyltransferase